ncbi:MAG: hypothetical protein CSA29_05520 [Desulfobacterales bacterium]|nr:MAG: hypothetical protein CSA29_05520 [Desulfobacterales bacterium]
MTTVKSSVVQDMSGVAQATLTTIGTASYDDGSGVKDYKLIWDDDNNGRSVVWLDYRHEDDPWSYQMIWASSLDTALTVNLYAEYTVDWSGSSWRLPYIVDGPVVNGYDGTTTAGYNITTSEMGHLFYEELGNSGWYDTSGNQQSVFGLTNTGVFENLRSQWYWSETLSGEATNNAWLFNMYYGQTAPYGSYNSIGGLAVRTGQVSLVPVPSAIILLGAGLLWVTGIGRKSRIDV